MRSIHFPKESFKESCKLSMSRSISMAVSVGDTVEIMSEDDGFSGAYYEAKVLAKKGTNKLIVEYKTLVTEENETVKLKEIVEGREARPIPPSINVSEFKILEKIDAYDNDGWWEGRIAKKIGENNYSVYFETTGDLLDYPICRLRPHQDYVYGEWIRSPTENFSVFLDMNLMLRRGILVSS